MAVGYVLVNVQPGSELEVFQSIAGLDMVQDATLLFGDYDIIVKMTAGRMSDIAAAVGIQSGSIFHHFKSKDEILRSVMEETIVYNTALMRAALAQAQGTRERLLALIRCELQSIMGGTGEAMAVLVYEWRSLSEAGQAQVLALRDTYEQIWLEVLGEARDAGYFNGDPFIQRRFLTGALSWTTTWFRSQGPMTLDQLAEEALSLVCKEA